MGDIHMQTTAKGDLPHLSYILRKPEPLGTEFKTVTCYVTGDLFFIDIDIGKEGTKDRNYHMELGDT